MLIYVVWLLPSQTARRGTYWVLLMISVEKLGFISWLRSQRLSFILSTLKVMWRKRLVLLFSAYTLIMEESLIQKSLMSYVRTMRSKDNWHQPTLSNKMGLQRGKIKLSWTWSEVCFREEDSQNDLARSYQLDNVSSKSVSNSSYEECDPKEAWSGFKPSVEHFKLFSCVSRVHVLSIAVKV